MIHPSIKISDLKDTKLQATFVRYIIITKRISDGASSSASYSH